MLVTNPSPGYDPNSFQSISKYTRYGLSLVVSHSIMFKYLGYVLNLNISSPGSGINSWEIYICIFRLGLDIYKVGFGSCKTQSYPTQPKVYLYFQFNKTMAVW